MRLPIALLVVLALPASAQSSAQEPPPSRDRLLADLERAMEEASETYRVTQRGSQIVFRRSSGASCTVAVPVTPETRAEAVGANLLSFQAAGIQWEDCANRQTTSRVRFYFSQQAGRDGALRASRALIDGWDREPTPPSAGRPRQPDAAPRSPLSPGFEKRVTGTLTARDRLFEDGRRFDEHTIHVPSGDRLVVDLRSSAFDTYLYVHSPSGEESSNDDWGGSTAHSRVTIDDPMSGAWTVSVTSYDAGETGPYTLDLRTEPRSAPPLPAPDGPGGSERVVLGGDFSVALNALLAAAPSFDAVKGARVQSSPHPGYEARASLPGAQEGFVQCPPTGCEALILFRSFAEGEFEGAGVAYSALSVLMQTISAGETLARGPYRHEPQEIAYGLGDDFVATDGLRIRTRLINTFDTAPGAARYHILVQIVP